MRRNGNQEVFLFFFFSPQTKHNYFTSSFFSLFLPFFFLISLNFQPLFLCLITRCYSQYDKSCTFYAKLFDTFYKRK